MIAGLVAASALALAVSSPAAADPIGDLMDSLAAQPSATKTALVPPTDGPDIQLQATLYHAGAFGVGGRDSLGCRVSPMRTAAIDPAVIPRHAILFIKETVGMVMPDGQVHDGVWYASDTGGAIKGQRIDLYTGSGSRSMKAFFERGINKAAVTARQIGEFEGCPADRPMGAAVASIAP